MSEQHELEPYVVEGQDPEEALQDLVKWISKSIHGGVRVMLVLDLPFRGLTMTFSEQPMDMNERMSMLTSAVRNLLSRRVNAQHTKRRFD